MFEKQYPHADAKIATKADLQPLGLQLAPGSELIADRALGHACLALANGLHMSVFHFLTVVPEREPRVSITVVLHAIQIVAWVLPAQAPVFCSAVVQQREFVSLAAVTSTLHLLVVCEGEVWEAGVLLAAVLLAVVIPAWVRCTHALGLVLIVVDEGELWVGASLVTAEFGYGR